MKKSQALNEFILQNAIILFLPYLFVSMEILDFGFWKLDEKKNFANLLDFDKN